MVYINDQLRTHNLFFWEGVYLLKFPKITEEIEQRDIL